MEKIDNSSKLRILLICDIPPKNAQTISDHIGALSRSSHTVQVFDNLGGIPDWLNLNYFHAIIIHYSIIMCSDNYLSESARIKIRDYKGIKGCFIQDEYRFINRTHEALSFMEMDIIFTCVPSGEIEKVYPDTILPKLKKVNVLTGYVPENLINTACVPYDQRPIDVCYRSREIPAWLGELGQEKIIIANSFKLDAENYGLKTDIDYKEKKRLYGQEWTNFLLSSKSCLGTESGASVFDFTGDIQKNVERHIEENPETSFDDLQRLYFKDLEGKIKLNQISPRCFEAACLKTLMILYEGDYSGVLIPWNHYVPLKKDHRNMKQVVDILRDSARSQKIIDQCYQDIVVSGKYSYREFTNLFDQELLNLNYQLYRPFKVDKNLTFGIFRLFSMTTIMDIHKFFKRLKYYYGNIKHETYLFIFNILLKRLSRKQKDHIKLLLRKIMRREIQN